jgi:hypothetical protein
MAGHKGEVSFGKEAQGQGRLSYRDVIVLAESRAVRDGGLRPIGDRGGTPRTHVIVEGLPGLGLPRAGSHRSHLGDLGHGGPAVTTI